jgi:general secretion pathway protein K
MKIQRANSQSGVAMIIAMVAIFALLVVAGGFAYSMKVEMRLAGNHDSETELEWLGRSGVELARYLVAEQLATTEKNHALNQKWAGATGVTNDIFQDIHLDNNELGHGVFSIKIVDQERKFNINTADQTILRQAMNLMGMDPVESSTVIDCILDWRDPDDEQSVNGAESKYYEGLNPPYFAKNGPIDDLSELLLIKGVTPEMYWGAGSTNVVHEVDDRRRSPRDRGLGQDLNRFAGDVGLVKLFTPISGPRININTAPVEVLQLIPMFDANTAQAIVSQRAGPDGVEGNEDDTPFHNVGELINVPGINRQIIQPSTRYLDVRSATFEVTVDARVGSYRREFTALLRCNSARDCQVLNFSWK